MATQVHTMWDDDDDDDDYYYYYYLLQLSFLLAVILTLIQTKQIIYVNKTIQKRSTNNTKHSEYKYTCYQNTHT